MTCKPCELALRDPRRNDFTVGCISCKARALAATGAHEESAAARKMTAQYRTALGTLFGDGWQAGNDAVKAWAARMGQADAPVIEAPAVVVARSLKSKWRK